MGLDIWGLFFGYQSDVDDFTWVDVYHIDGGRFDDYYGDRVYGDRICYTWSVGDLIYVDCVDGWDLVDVYRSDGGI